MEKFGFHEWKLLYKKQVSRARTINLTHVVCGMELLAVALDYGFEYYIPALIYKWRLGMVNFKSTPKGLTKQDHNGVAFIIACLYSLMQGVDEKAKQNSGHLHLSLYFILNTKTEMKPHHSFPYDNDGRVDIFFTGQKCCGLDAVYPEPNDKSPISWTRKMMKNCKITCYCESTDSFVVYRLAAGNKRTINVGSNQRHKKPCRR